MEEVIKVAQLTDTSFIGSRYSGEEIRHRIKKAIDSGSRVILDFENISGITQGFADEAIGVLIRAFGVDTVLKHVKVRNANDKVRLILNWVANYSKKTNSKLISTGV